MSLLPYPYAFLLSNRTEAGEWNPLRVRGAYGFGKGLGLVAAGGYAVSDPNDHLKSVVATKDGYALTTMREMPITLQDHCLVVLEDGLFMAGGESHDEGEDDTQFRRNAYLYSLATETWKEVEMMRVGRKRPVCGRINGQNGKSGRDFKKALLATPRLMLF